MTKLNRSIDRGLMVLEVIHRSGASSLAFLADQTDLPKPTLLRICATLEKRRWLSRRSSDGFYKLGSGFPHSGSMPELADRLVAVAKEEIVRLSADTGLGVDLAAAIGEGRIEIVDTTRVFKKHGVFPDTVGFRPSPTDSALGVAFLMGLVETGDFEALQLNEKGQAHEIASSLPQLLKFLTEGTKRGYAIRAQGHWGRAVDYGELPAAIAVPIISGTEAIGALNLVWNASDQSVEAVAKAHLRRLRSTAKRIGQSYSEFT